MELLEIISSDEENEVCLVFLTTQEHILNNVISCFQIKSHISWNPNLNSSSEAFSKESIPECPKVTKIRRIVTEVTIKIERTHRFFH
jgi:hypothetical protein